MVLRWAALSAVLVSGAFVSQTLTQATVVLSNGQRLAGAVTFLTEPAIVLGGPLRTVLALQAPGGRQISVPLENVAILDFVGGKPSAAEVDALDADSPHVLVLRNGNTRRGRLIGIVDGEFVRWENEAGARVDIAIRNVSRIHLQLPKQLAAAKRRGSPARH